jgi:hypothetical protein
LLVQKLLAKLIPKLVLKFVQKLIAKLGSILVSNLAPNLDLNLNLNLSLFLIRLQPPGQSLGRPLHGRIVALVQGHTIPCGRGSPDPEYMSHDKDSYQARRVALSCKF